MIQGYEDVLLIHKKGPGEILIPTVIYSLTGHLNEKVARLPFALANLTALFAIFLLRWRFFGPVAGWSAAILLALDGYLIDFARIVQYQSIVFLMSVLVVLLSHRLEQEFSEIKDQEQGLTEKKGVLSKGQGQALLLLAGLFLATGLLSHYEALLALLPSTFLFVASFITQLRTQKSPYPSFLFTRALYPLFLKILALYPLFLKILALLPAIIILASFYVPLYWRTTGRLDISYTVFNQIIGPDASMIGQLDAQPGCDKQTTNKWSVGELVEDQYRIPIFPDANAGTYPLNVGMYQPDPSSNLPIYDANGDGIGNSIELTQITIEEAP